MDEAAEHIAPPDRTMPRSLVKGDRRSLPYSLMWARLIIVRDVGGQDLV